MSLERIDRRQWEDGEMLADEAAMFALWLLRDDGVCTERDFINAFDRPEMLVSALRKLACHGYVELIGTKYAITDRGRGIVNTLEPNQQAARTTHEACPEQHATDADSTPELIQRFVAGDRAAGEELVQSHLIPLRRTLTHYVTHGDPGGIDLEDLVQSVFMRAFSAIGRFEWRGRGSFLAWLTQIGRNEVQRDVERRRYSDAERDSAVDPQSLDLRHQVVEPNPIDSAIRLEEFRILERALDSLSAADRHLVITQRLLGLDYASLAGDFGISEDAVRTKLSRALNRVARYLDARREGENTVG